MRRLLFACLLALVAAACNKTSGPPATPAPGAKPARPLGPPAAPARPAPPPLPKELADKLAPLQEKMKAEPRSFAAAVAVGDLYYDGSRLVDAVDAYRQALERGSETLSLLDELSARARPPAAGPANPAVADEESKRGCKVAGSADVEAADAKARQLRDEADADGALACARAAARPILDTAARRAQALFLVGNVDQAVAEYEKVLKRDPGHAESLFFLGALQLNRRSAGRSGLQAAAEAWRRFLVVAPKDHPRRAEVEKTLPSVETALANADKAQPGAAAPASGPPPKDGAGERPEGMGAMGGHAGAEAPADLDKALDEAETALAKGDAAAAVKAYLGAMNAAPDDARVQAGLAATQFLKGTAMAQKIFDVAVARDPKAVDDLAGRLTQKGNPGLARTLRQQLVEAAPDYAARTDLKARAK